MARRVNAQSKVAASIHMTSAEAQQAVLALRARMEELANVAGFEQEYQDAASALERVLRHGRDTTASRRTESAKSAAFYDEDQSEDEYRAEMQALINSGTAWKMEGSVGRAAMSLIESGMCVLGEEGHRDYWGNYLPSRYEVEPGTKGSVEYAESMGWTPVKGL